MDKPSPDTELDRQEMSSTLEWTDDIATGYRTFVLRLSRADMTRADFTSFDRALFDDIDNGEPSNTPIADRLLGLETMVRRIEEAAIQAQEDKGEK